ncbi:MAG: hypothetical protein ACJAT2_002481 [Bacteriovoracaceae bacterium]|jgi:hypothetical protein
MKKSVLCLLILCCSLGAFAIEEGDALKFLIKESLEFFKSKKKASSSKLRGLSHLRRRENLSKSDIYYLDKSISYQDCSLKTYEMLEKISKGFQEEDALSSSFLIRKKLKLSGDDEISMFDFFVLPYLEYLNYKTSYLTAQVNRKSNFLTNEAMPFFVSELNVDGFCAQRSNRQHYGENGEHERLDLELAPSILVNDVARSKKRIVNEEIERLEEYVSRARAK